ncbi:MAG TPA: hypothetical protein VEX41_02875 [Candidatus Eisenbacteria bacterium]|nr:hypothetical protein [Candidatus Eisenbacteria bacterium]
MERAGDRYESLLNHLRAGRQPAPEAKRPPRIQWHPIAARLAAMAIVIGLGWLLLLAGLAVWREFRIETWSGPDQSVESGQRLPGCPADLSFRDALFPAWVRFEGSVFAGAARNRAVGALPNAAYPTTGYRLGDLELFRILNTPQGQAGDQILLKFVNVQTGELYERVPACSEPR